MPVIDGRPQTGAVSLTDECEDLLPPIMDGVRLLLCDDPTEARERALALETTNGRRQAMDEGMLNEAIEEVEETVAAIENDYEQGELKIAACFSQDPVMLEAFRAGQDLHLLTGCEVRRQPLDLGLHLAACLGQGRILRNKHTQFRRIIRRYLGHRLVPPERICNCHDISHRIQTVLRMAL